MDGPDDENWTYVTDQADDRDVKRHASGAEMTEGTLYVYYSTAFTLCRKPTIKHASMNPRWSKIAALGRANTTRLSSGGSASATTTASTQNETTPKTTTMLKDASEKLESLTPHPLGSTGIIWPSF